jgi:hypothetical protein
LAVTSTPGVVSSRASWPRPVLSARHENQRRREHPQRSVPTDGRRPAGVVPDGRRLVSTGALDADGSGQCAGLGPHGGGIVVAHLGGGVGEVVEAVDEHRRRRDRACQPNRVPGVTDGRWVVPTREASRPRTSSTGSPTDTPAPTLSRPASKSALSST